MEEILLNRKKRPRLIWCEPYDGIDIKYLDNGFCNRVFHWEMGFFLNQKNDFKFDLQIEELYWPELEIISLPKTQIFEKQNNLSLQEYNILFRTSINENDNIPISKKFIEKFIATGNYKIDENYNYYSDYGYDYIWSMYKLYSQIIERPLKNIRLRNSNIENFIKNFFHNKIGIHIRRGYGVQKTKQQAEYLNDLKLSVYFDENYTAPYEFYDDEYYFRVIDKLNKIFPNIEFYISTDLEESSLVHFKSQYNNIYSFSDILKHPDIEYYYYSFKDDFRKQMCKNMIDLFSLAHTKFLIKSPKSTWSQFAEQYRNTPSIDISKNDSIIVKEYIKNA